MIKSLITGWIAVALLLVSLASLSSATCPWFLRGELYSAQCGVIKEIGPSSGLLANDPQAKAVLNPELIKIDPKYGTISVRADGSFTYSPSPNIRQGTFVMFKYNATNGACRALNPAIAKFQVSCRCRPNIVAVDPILLPKSLEEIRTIIQKAGVGCMGCGDITTPVDLKDIDLDANGNPVAGTYSFCIKCPGCQVACGQVTLIDGCDAEVEDLAFCEGTVTLEELEAMAEEKTVCIGCDIEQVLDYSDVSVDSLGYVTGGSYTATCGDATQSGGSDTGYITVWPGCDVAAPAIEICAGSTQAELAEAIDAQQPGCAGSGCDATPAISYGNVEYDIEGYVIGGKYTVTCITDNGCESSAEGSIAVVEKCGCELIGMAVGCAPPKDIEMEIMEFQIPCSGCDATPIYQFPSWPVENGMVPPGSYQYNVSCPGSGGLEGCDSTCSGEVIVDCQIICPSEVENYTFCEGTVKFDELVAMAEVDARCPDCDLLPALDFSGVTVDEEGFVTGGSYEGACGDITQSGGTDTGYITVWPMCSVEAPAAVISSGSTEEELKAAINLAVPGCTGSGCDASPVISLENVSIENGFVTGGTYSVTCITSPGCQASAEGEIHITYGCEIMAPVIEICEGGTQEELEAAVDAAQPRCTGSGCDATPSISYGNVKYDREGYVIGGTYTVTCIAGNGQEFRAEGSIIVVEKCGCELIGLTLGCDTPEKIEEEIIESQTPCSDCDATPIYQFPDWPVENGQVPSGIYEYTVFCPDAGGLEGCDSLCTGEIAVTCQTICPCEAVAPDIPICPDDITLSELEDLIYSVAECSNLPGSSEICDTMPQIDTGGVVVKDGYVVPGSSSYRVICQEEGVCEAVESTGRITLRADCEDCDCTATAPDICLPIVCADTRNGFVCRDYSSDYYMKYVICAIKGANGGCTGDCMVDCTGDCAAMRVIIPDNINWAEPAQFEYTLVCGSGDCTKSDTGLFTLDWSCGCGPCGCEPYGCSGGC